MTWRSHWLSTAISVNHVTKSMDVPIFHLTCTTTILFGPWLLYQSLFQNAKQRRCKSCIDGCPDLSLQPPWPTHNHPLHLCAPLSCLVPLVQPLSTTPITQEARLLMTFWNNVPPSSVKTMGFGARILPTPPPPRFPGQVCRLLSTPSEQSNHMQVQGSRCWA